MPYVMARFSFEGAMDAPAMINIRERVLSRVKLGADAKPWYHSDAEQRTDAKAAQSLGSESVVNASILVAYDSRTAKTLAPETRKALDLMLSRQKKDGSWAWLDYSMEPWESADAKYYGAALAAVTLGSAGGYASESSHRAQVDRLRGFLKGAFAKDRLNLHNELMLLWASSKLDGILTETQRKKIITDVLSTRQANGSWKLSDLGAKPGVPSTWKEAGEHTSSDGYSTGFTTFALLQAGVPPNDPRIRSSITWLKNAQGPGGNWASASVSYNSEQNHKFQSDAGTSFAVMALKAAGEL
jgi:squalene-hopene/tetraprenyl-beta-curcumene cyclase